MEKTEYLYFTWEWVIPPTITVTAVEAFWQKAHDLGCSHQWTVVKQENSECYVMVFVLRSPSREALECYLDAIRPFMDVTRYESTTGEGFTAITGKSLASTGTMNLGEWLRYGLGKHNLAHGCLEDKTD
jgi:hypothetical protein